MTHELRRRLQEAEAIIKDAPTHEDLDAAVFQANLFRQRAQAAESDCKRFAEHFREWFANHFEDFPSDVNAQLLSLDNEAAAFLAKARGEV